MKRIAIIGAGISGLASARLLKEKYGTQVSVTIYEKEAYHGGLIHCERVNEQGLRDTNGSLFHTCGGHVFNTQNEQVLTWFWQQFHKEQEFLKTDRNSVIFLPNGQHIPYPIENFAYLLDELLQRSFIQDLLSMARQGDTPSSNFQTFLRTRFGDTLYHLYFEPYNKKVWRRPLSDVPLEWLQGKLPMPTLEEIIYNNFNRVAEKQFVHSTFYYERQNGSNLIADRLAEGLDIRYKAEISKIQFSGHHYTVAGEQYDNLIFTGSLKTLPALLRGIDINQYAGSIQGLQFHGTTSVFCSIDKNPYSWIYLPDNKYSAHRIICTGNFAPSNNKGTIADNRTTATIEFTDFISKDDIIRELQRIPLHPTYITHHYNPLTYPIQSSNTRYMLQSLKKDLSEQGFYLTGRFADWEYYNMDAAIAAAMNTIKMI